MGAGGEGVRGSVRWGGGHPILPPISACILAVSMPEILRCQKRLGKRGKYIHTHDQTHTFPHTLKYTRALKVNLCSIIIIPTIATTIMSTIIYYYYHYNNYCHYYLLQFLNFVNTTGISKINLCTIDIIIFITCK